MLVWDVTCNDTLALFYSALVTREAGVVAAEMEQRKKAKNSHLDFSHFFVPVAVETLGVLGPEAGHFIKDFSRRICSSHLRPTVSLVPVAACGRSSPTEQCSGHPWDGREGLCCGV